MAAIPREPSRMRLKRPDMLLLERRDVAEFSLASRLHGGPDTVPRAAWFALAPHLDVEVEVDAGAVALLGELLQGEWHAAASLGERLGLEELARLVDAGVLVGDHAAHAPLREREARLRETAWWPPAAVAQAFGRWDGVDVALDDARLGARTLTRMIAADGPPPPEAVELAPRAQWRSLPASATTTLDELLAARTTCRNFDPSGEVSLDVLATMLRRTFGAQAAETLAPGAVMLKKHSPSGGGLHPIDAYVLVQRVDGIAPGLYHYHPVAHALQPLPAPADGLAGQARALVAGQHWFADAPVLVLMAARFERSFWKYRRHPKAWRVIQLDAGHLSQTLYLSATELGLGAFVTGAINDRHAERLFGFDGLATGAVAACGFGPRAARVATIEFDPLGRVNR
jgi:putative peptide maturation dehydrogenase